MQPLRRLLISITKVGTEMIDNQQTIITVEIDFEDVLAYTGDHDKSCWLREQVDAKGRLPIEIVNAISDEFNVWFAVSNVEGYIDQAVRQVWGEHHQGNDEDE